MSFSSVACLYIQGHKLCTVWRVDRQDEQIMLENYLYYSDHDKSTAIGINCLEYPDMHFLVFRIRLYTLYADFISFKKSFTAINELEEPHKALSLLNLSEYSKFEFLFNKNL
jgi:hypothetical protein